MIELAGRKVLVVGLARSGVAAARLLAREGAHVTVNDRRPASELSAAVGELLPAGVRFELGGHDLALFEGSELIVVSPGVPLANPEFAVARRAGVPVIGEVELAASFVREPIVGITGTNGKSTTTALVGHLLERAGKRVFVGGNLGRPLSDRVLAGGDLDVCVVELSSFQLEAVSRLRCHVAVLTNLSPDHLDRYPSVEAYYEAKRAIFAGQTPDDYAVLNAADPRVMALHTGAPSLAVTFAAGAPEARAARDDGGRLVVRKLPDGGGDEIYEDLGRALRGAHNRENAMAAILAARLAGASAQAVRAALPSFAGLPHRLEVVRVLRGAEWIDDSKATNVDSTTVALKALPGPLIRIAGGRGKGAPYAPLRPLLPGRVKVLLTIGEDAGRLASELSDVVRVVDCGTLERAVAAARELVAEVDAVLLSPACASYDQFRSYEHRGAEFRRLVEALLVTAESPAVDRGYDRVLLWAVLGLTAIGLTMVYSASAVSAASGFGDPLYFVKRQAVAATLGLVAMAVLMRTGYRRLEALAYPVLVLTLIALVLVLIPGIGTVAGGARRWIRLPGFSFQPGELAKVAMVLYLSRSLARKKEKVRTFSIGFVPHTLVAGLLVILVLLQPDFGTAVTIALLLFTLLFVAGARISWLVGSLIVAAPLAIHAVASSPYRMKRILAFLDPWAHRQDIGYQVAESLMSVGSGGLFGLGLGAGKQKLFYLPEAHTDFIVSVIGEELGLAGIALVLALFAVLVWRGVRAAFNAPDAFGAYLALGITSLLGLQAIVNMSVAFGLLPTKGLTLPFISYGGTSLALSLGAAGVLLAISSGKGGFLRPQHGRAS